MSSRPKLLFEYFKQLFAQVSAHEGVITTATQEQHLLPHAW